MYWLTKNIDPNNIDNIICAEIPDIEQDPVLHDLVLRHMIHGPCGIYNEQSPCMNDKMCSKYFPKEFINHTQVGNDGYPLYRRRNKENGGHVGYINMKSCKFKKIEIENK